MKHRVILGVSVALLVFSIIATPTIGRTQQTTMQEDEGAFFLGSMIFSILNIPLKLATCLGTQATAAVAYTATFGVAGNYDGGTNGREIGEIARRSCTGAWVITPQQVKKDYGD